MLQCCARVLESGCQLCCTCTLAMIAVNHFLLRSSHSLSSMHRLGLCRRSVTGRGSSKAVHRPKDEENFSSLHQTATKGRHDTLSQQQRDFISHQRQYGTWLNYSVLAVVLAGSKTGPIFFNGGRERKFLARSKSWNVPSVEQQQICSCDIRITRSTVLYVWVRVHLPLVKSPLQTDISGLCFLRPSPPTATICELLPKHWLS